MGRAHGISVRVQEKQTQALSPEMNYMYLLSKLGDEQYMIPNRIK